jgi:tripartite-type tricarboxylate transporter receptor subunit TctC
LAFYLSDAFESFAIAALFFLKEFMRNVLHTLFFLLLGTLGECALAQGSDYPSKPIRIFVGQGAGGGMDTQARIVAQHLATKLAQPVVVENKVGAGGIIATEWVSRSAPDGYSLLMGPIGNMVFTPILTPNLKYSPTKDFAPVSLVATFPLVVVVNSKSKINSVAELVAYMKANPEKSNFGGSGPAFQFANELFKLKTGSPGEFIQYKSMSETITALLAGDLVMSMVDTGPATTHISSGTLRALAVTSSQRLPSMPQVPTMAELGLRDIEFRYWSGIFAPAGTPKNVIKKLEVEINHILKQPEVIAQMSSNQVISTGSTSEELSKLIALDLKRWGAVADSAKISKQD